jgi:hypothetical protein
MLAVLIGRLLLNSGEPTLQQVLANRLARAGERLSHASISQCWVHLSMRSLRFVVDDEGEIAVRNRCVITPVPHCWPVPQPTAFGAGELNLPDSSANETENQIKWF